MRADVVVPDWPAPATVRAMVTTRVFADDAGDGFGAGNLAAHVGDDAARVAASRRRLSAGLGGITVGWLSQVHGTGVVELGTAHAASAAPPVADAAWTRARGIACAVLTADCLPVIVCDRDGTLVGVAHCGWRGLAGGVLTALIEALPAPTHTLTAWIGPGIGQARYEVGAEVREAFVRRAACAGGEAFRPGRVDGKFLADLEAVTRLELRALGIRDIHGGGFCTVRDPRFYSFRRDGVTGRMATLVWLS